MVVTEPNAIYPEKEFQKAISSLVERVLSDVPHRFIMLQDFGLDIAVFLDAPPSGIVRFFEVKVFGGQRAGGVGFGNARGIGTQIDLLLSTDKSLSLFDPVVRWVLADATKPLGTSRYAFFTCLEAKSAAMGGVSRGKSNNLRISAFRDRLLDWTQLCNEVQKFLLG